MSNSLGWTTRRAAAFLFVLLGAGLASCTRNALVAGPGSQGATVDPVEEQSPTGRLAIVVVDQNGAYIARANVEVRSTGKAFWRKVGTTEWQGTVRFNEVPPEVEVNVVASNGAQREVIAVAQGGGSTEARITVTTVGGGESTNRESGGNTRL